MPPDLASFRWIAQGDLMPIDTTKIQEILSAAHAEGRTSLYEHECYGLQEAIGAEAAPASRLIPIGNRPTPADLDHLDRRQGGAQGGVAGHHPQDRGQGRAYRRPRARGGGGGLRPDDAGGPGDLRDLSREPRRRGPVRPHRPPRSRPRAALSRIASSASSCAPSCRPDSQGFATELFVGIR